MNRRREINARGMTIPMAVFALVDMGVPSESAGGAAVGEEGMEMLFEEGVKRGVPVAIRRPVGDGSRGERSRAFCLMAMGSLMMDISFGDGFGTKGC